MLHAPIAFLMTRFRGALHYEPGGRTFESC
jgi:hypothetical protein